MKRASQSCRLRKVECPECGYTIRMARSWMNMGLPKCPCGHDMQPTAPADLAWLGIIGQDDMKPSDWTIICRENGWEDCIQRKGAAAKAWERSSASRLSERKVGAAHCVFAGCGRWVASGADRCTAGHAQRDCVEQEAAIPF